MTELFFVVGIFVVALSLRKLLQNGLLLNKHKVFITNNLKFRYLPSGKLHLRAKKGRLTDRFEITLSTREIDLSAFTDGHRPMDKHLDKAGYRVYRLIHLAGSINCQPNNTRSTTSSSKVVIGDFALHPAAQSKFTQFAKHFTQL